MCDIASAIIFIHTQMPQITHGNIRAVGASQLFTVYKSLTEQKSNILVDGEGRVYVSDIGIRLILSTPKQPGYELRWAAPEKVLNDQPHNTQCDVWSFAATIYEVI